MKEKITKQK